MARINFDPMETAITITALQNYKKMIHKTKSAVVPDNQIMSQHQAIDIAETAIDKLVKN